MTPSFIHFIGQVFIEHLQGIRSDNSLAFGDMLIDVNDKPPCPQEIYILVKILVSMRTLSYFL